MKITNSLIKQFELEQKEYGTENAIYNLMWNIAAELLNDIGIRHIKTSEGEIVDFQKCQHECVITGGGQEDGDDFTVYSCKKCHEQMIENGIDRNNNCQ